jgi:hypothetical protein
VLLQSKSRDGFTTADAAWMEGEIVQRLLVWESIALENKIEPRELSLSSHEVDWLGGVVDGLFRILRLLGHFEFADVRRVSDDVDSERIPEVWLLRAGREASQVETFRSRGQVRISFTDVCNHDLTDISPDALRSAGAGSQAIGQLFRFRDRVQVGDYVMTPAVGTSSYHVGRITGSYRFDTAVTEFPHTRDVAWVGELDPISLTEEVRRSLGSIMTLFHPGDQEQLRARIAEL